MATAPWLAVMQSLDGTHAEGDNPTIMAWPKFIAQTYPDMAAYCATYTHDSISWCGLTVAYCMAKVGIRPIFGSTDTDRFLWALAWKQFGNIVNKGDEQPGDILVFVWASGGHHVTLYEGKDARGFYICHGGNQSHAVNTQHYSPAYCVGIRRPTAVAVQPAIAQPPTVLPVTPTPTPLTLPPLAAFAEEAAALVARQLIAASPQAAAEAAALRAKLTIVREVADAALGLLDKVAPTGGSTLPLSPGPAGLPLPDFLQPPPAPVAPTPTANATDRFNTCVALVLKSEGGNDDDPRDPGGRTSRGITQREWDSWRQMHPGLAADVWQAPQDQVLAIYKANYWDVLQCDSLPGGVDYAVFDYGVNSGNSRSAKTLQGILGVSVDGTIGPITLAAVAKADAKTLINQICDQRMAFLKGLSTWPTFGRGWTNRVTSVRSDALAMVSTGATPMSMPSTQSDQNAQVAAPVGSAITSKVNWTGIATAVIPPLVAAFGGKVFGLTSDQLLSLVPAITVITGVLTVVFRTYGTTTILPQSLPGNVRNQLGV